MDFRDVNTGQLAADINNCLNSLDCSTSEEIRGSIAEAGVWQAASRSTLQTALGTLVDDRYQSLKDLLDSYTAVPGKMARHTELRDEIERLEAENARLAAQNQSTSRDLDSAQSNGAPASATAQMSTSITNNNNAIRDNNTTITNHRAEIERLENEITGIVGS